MKKLLIICLSLIVFCSCKKEVSPETTSEWKGNTFVRVETVEKDGSVSYSNITRLNIK